MMLGSKDLLTLTDASEKFRFELLRSKLHPQFANIRSLLICYVNHSFLMFGGSQVQKLYYVSMKYVCIDADMNCDCCANKMKNIFK